MPAIGEVIKIDIKKLSRLTNWIYLLIEKDIFGTNCLIRSKTAIE